MQITITLSTLVSVLKLLGIPLFIFSIAAFYFRDEIVLFGTRFPKFVFYIVRWRWFFWYAFMIWALVIFIRGLWL